MLMATSDSFVGKLWLPDVLKLADDPETLDNNASDLSQTLYKL